MINFHHSDEFSYQRWIFISFPSWSLCYILIGSSKWWFHIIEFSSTSYFSILMIHFIIYHECYENPISICHINIFHILLMKFHWIMSFINSYQFNYHDKTSSYWFIFFSLMINTQILVIFSSKWRLFNVLEFSKISHFQQNY